MKKGIVAAKWVRENAAKFDDREKFLKAAVKATGASRKRISSCVGQMLGEGKIKNSKLLRNKSRIASKGQPTARRSGAKLKLPRSIPFDMVKKAYDDDGRLTEGLEALGSNLIKDNDFRLDLEIGLDRWRAVTGQKKWDKFKIDLRGKQFKGTFWGNPDVIAELRKSVDVL
jgi:hypothetical protein